MVSIDVRRAAPLGGTLQNRRHPRQGHQEGQVG